ncbi:MAG: hypothetical protein J0L93_03465 [Deltaproteobacteria bacterium]|nr:hypothetical protein [Deltaproteobacteria bacterium]
MDRRRVAAGERGFSIIELMISVVVMAGVTLAVMHIINKIQAKQRESSLVSDYVLAGQQLDSLFSFDLKNSEKIDGEYTNAGSQFASTQTFGILRSPFQDTGSDASDGLQLFVADPSLSTSSSFDIADISGTSGSVTLTVNGDFTATATLAEDLFIVVVNERKELFQVSGSVHVTGSAPNQVSTFSTIGSDANVVNAIRSAIQTNLPQIYRVQRVTYQIGNGSGVTRGLYRSVNGVASKVGEDVATMQIRYELATTDSDKTSDCASKNNSRWFAHSTQSNQCSWNNIVAIHLEIVFESSSDSGAPENFNPHIPQVVDGKVRYTMHISKSPSGYTLS